MNVSDLREILQYVPRFREKIFVVAVDGEIAASPNFANILLDLAVLRSLSIRVVLVHGASHQIQEAAKRTGVEPSNTDGTGITDAATLELSIDAAMRLTHKILEGLASVDLRAAYANAVIAHPAGILGGIDQGHTGRIERVDAKCLHMLLHEGIIPVVAPLGFDGEGHTYRVNSDHAASELAEALRATKVIYLSADTRLAGGAVLPRQLGIAEAEELGKKRRNGEAPNTYSKIDYGAKACRQGVPRVHILDGTINEALLEEVFSNEGIGTMIYSNEYQQIRKIFKKDVRFIVTLIRQSMDSEELVRRTRAEILERMQDYWVLEIDGKIVGCVALHSYPGDSCGELACLYVHKDHENEGHGRKLMAFTEALARDKGLKQLVALSTQAYKYLQLKGGFRESAPEILPVARRKKYESGGRQSKVLIKDLV
ncbi:MAG: amino-acid N-acetyltransferase [Chthoniobacterales bacterium]|nr:amino-acid N-acetyltransferase [Chthoniobacterales bacterium]